MTAPSPNHRIVRLASLLLAIATALGAVACEDAARSSPRPSPSLVDVEFTPQPTPTVRPTARPTPSPTFVAIPIGWDESFCALFAEIADAHELIIDVERAIKTQTQREARLLARDLRNAASRATTRLEELDEWPPSDAAGSELTSLADLYTRAGTRYGAWFADQRRADLRRARALRRDVAGRTPAANDGLAELDEIGVRCDDLPLRLEEF